MARPVILLLAVLALLLGNPWVARTRKVTTTTNLARDSMSRVGARPFALGVLLWILAAGATLGAILAGAIR